MSSYLCPWCRQVLDYPRIELNFTSLHEKLRSEYGLNSVQPAEIRQILDSLQQDLKDLSSADSPHASCILEYAGQTGSLLSPIRKIPDELLRLIFEYSCDMNRFVQFAKDTPLAGPDGNIRNKPALVISSTCSRWRINALSMPLIWSGISLEWVSFTYYSGQDGTPSQSLTTFLDRSSQLPLTINLLFQQATPIFSSGRLHPIAEQLVGQAHRWKSLTFNSHYAFIEELFLQGDDGEDVKPQLPLLEYLELKHSADNLDIFLDVVPRLKTLKMPYAYPFRQERFQFPKLQHLELISDQDVLEVLTYTPNIISLTIAEYYGGPADDTIDLRTYSPSCVTLSSLKSLIVHHGNIKMPQGLFPSIFSFLIFPALRNLHFVPAEKLQLNPDFWANFDSLMTFFERSSCPLTTLTIEGLPISDSNLVRLLLRLPALENLTVVDTFVPYTPITDQFLESLDTLKTSVLRPEKEPLVPKLNSLTLETEMVSFRDDLIMDIVSSRWIPSATSTGSANSSVSYPSGTVENAVRYSVSCIRELTLKFDLRQCPGDVYESLEQYEKSGLRMIVLWHKSSENHSESSN